MTLTLRSKGLLALALMAVYVALTAWFLAVQRRELVIISQQIESHRSLEAMLAPTFNTLAHTLVHTQEILTGPNYSEDPTPRYSEIAMSLDPLLERLEKLRNMDGDVGAHIDQLERVVNVVRTVPSGKNLEQVRNAEQELIAHLNDVLETVDHRIEVLTDAFRRKQQLMTLVAVGTAVGGALATAAVILIFFTRLARDIEGLKQRAHAIVSGYSGPPLSNRRNDEVGGLIDAVNRMQDDLRRWEQQQEIGRQQRFHQDKMAAVGSMAAAIGHEVSNPIAAIAGIAQFLIDETREAESRQAQDDGSKIGKLAHDFGVQILRQTERISLIMRQLSNLTRAHSPEPELLDLNALVHSTCNFIGYDKRFQGIDFQYDLDRDLPAVTAVADHLTQVLMNLLINAADAMDGTPKDGAAQVRISTRLTGEEVQLDVKDSGHGMTPEVLARAFEESFTTKPAGRGRGIGLFLCKTLIEQQGGRIQIASKPEVGTTVRLYLPLRAAAQGEG
jgi:signal transduction histidine kinase